MDKPVVELKHITKRFARVLANDDVSMTIHKGEVVALLGENGAGKSTIMKILYGLYHATSGEIYIDGKEHRISSPKEAMDLGISMIQQHFSLVAAHTVTENIILGNCKGNLDAKAKEKEIQELAKQYGFDVPAGEYIRNLSVGTQQKVEILKALYLNARILIMDEPTAVLTPQEIDTLMAFVKQYVAKGNSVVFITHKMKEVMQVSDTIVVMRGGKICGIVKREDTNEKELAHMMIGRDLDVLQTPGQEDLSHNKKRLVLENISIAPKNQAPLLEDINFEIHEGEVLGVAGVSDNGQQELCELIYGARKATSGRILLDDKDITGTEVKDRIAMGIGYTASDRYRYAMVQDMSLAENMFLKSSYLKNWVKNGIVKWKAVQKYTRDQIKTYAVKAPDDSVPMGSLSGGNQQKVIVAREVDMGHKVIIFDQRFETSAIPTSYSLKFPFAIMTVNLGNNQCCFCRKVLTKIKSHQFFTSICINNSDVCIFNHSKVLESVFCIVDCHSHSDCLIISWNLIEFNIDYLVISVSISGAVIAHMNYAF